MGVNFNYFISLHVVIENGHEADAVIVKTGESRVDFG